MKKNCLIAQSGGPTGVINASVYGIYKEAKTIAKIDNIYGAINGIKGVLNSNIFSFDDENEEEIEKLKTTPSSALGSCRHRLKEIEDSDEEYKIIFNVFSKLNIGYFFYIGGNDSMDTVKKLSEYAKKHNIDIKIIGVPKTIDNDLPETDHCPGFGSAAKYICTSVIETLYDAEVYNKNIVTIVETMGRNAGWLAASAALASEKYDNCPDLIYLPEVAFDFDEFKQDVNELLEKRGKVMIVVSEGIKNIDGEYIAAAGYSNCVKDAFGHVQLGGAGDVLKSFVKEEIEPRVKLVQFDVLQRAATHCASASDLKEAECAGRIAVQFAIKGETGKMIAYKCYRDKEYNCELKAVDVSKVANKEKKIPRNWINARGNFVNKECLDYMRPLIQGEIEGNYCDGLPAYSNLNRVKIEL